MVVKLVVKLARSWVGWMAAGTAAKMVATWGCLMVGKMAERWATTTAVKTAATKVARTVELKVH